LPVADHTKAFLAGGGEMGAMMRAHDWSMSPAGPPEGWPQSLRSAVGLMLANKHIMFVAWGPDLAFLYNDAYRPVFGQKHPWALGRPFREVWSEVWDDVEPLVNAALGGEATWSENLHLVLERNGYPEDCWFTFSYSPVRDEGGAVVGLFCAASETTDVVLAEQRQAFRLQLEECLRDLADPKEVMAATVETLGRYLGVSRVGYGEMQADDQAIVYETDYADGVEHLIGAFPIDSFGPGNIVELRRGLTTTYPDVEADPRTAGVGFAAIEARAAMAVPLVRDGRLRAVLYLNHREVRDWPADEVRLVEEVAARTWSAVEHARAEAALHESESHFRALVNATANVVYRMSPDWREMRQLDGLGFIVDTEAPTVDWVETYIPADERPRVRKAIERAIEAKDVFELEHRVLRVDGAVGWTFSRAIPLLDDAGEIVEWFGAASDVTARVKADQSFTRLFEASPAPFLVLAPDAPRFTITEVNDAYLAATMRARKEVIGRGVFEAYPDNPEDTTVAGVSHLRASLERVLATRRPDELPGLHYDVARPDGTYEERWWSPINSPVLDENGEVEAIIHNANDVTQDRRAETALSESEARQAFLLRLSDALRAEPSGDAIANRALRMLFEQMRLDRCYVCLYRLAEDTCEFPHQVHDDRLAPWPAQIRLSDFPKGLQILFDQTLVIDDVVKMEGFSDSEQANFAAFGVGALINATLREGENNPLWAVAVASTCARVWTQGEISLVEEVAERTWAAVERARTETALRESEARFREMNETLEGRVAERTVERNRVWNTSRGLLMIANLDGVFRAVNPAWTQTLGYTEAETIGRSYHDFIVPDDIQPTVEATAVAASGIDVDGFENRYRHKDGSIRRLSWNTSVEEGLIYAFGRDVTDERAREAEIQALAEQLRQSQKMEAMGSLTGGVAHDFNNLLTPIVGSLDMLQRKGLGNEREQRLIAGAVHSADRAKTLVQRLLAFARRQPLRTTSVDLTPLVKGMAELVSSTTGPQIKVVVDAPEGLPPAKADLNQLEMAILNLAVNARDAMPEGGTVRISVLAETVGHQHRANLPPGRYLQLSVADTGTGMDEETLRRAIEPFFSTKGIGKGTGLGLSMVHGLASQLGGAVMIQSTPGVGTNVELWLPQSTEPLTETRPVAHTTSVVQGFGTALLVDDEDLVRLSTADMLIDLGYAVVEAASAEEALKLVDRGLQPDVLITDHLMPGMTGTELARTLQVSRPGTKVLIVSGYADADGVAPDLPRLTKPFRSVDLAESLASLA
jgi:PAS domain S-box-containing protein